MKKKALAQIPLLLLTLVFAIPLYITVISAFKPTGAVVANPLLPYPITLDNMQHVLANPRSGVANMYLNSVTLTGCVILLCLFVSALASYFLARSLRKKLTSGLRIYFLLGMMVPGSVTLLPLCVLMGVFSIPGNIITLIPLFVAGSMPISIFLMTSFIKTLPRELDEAASLEGASTFTVFWRILFPLLKPCTATTGIFIGMGCWNDFLTPLVFGQIKTITVGIYTAIGPYSSDWGLVFAYVLCASLPLLIGFYLAQNQFISGLTSGAMKG